ncbi:magnesium transporter NIPA-domain-containing protein [Aspergillus unguis]
MDLIARSGDSSGGDRPPAYKAIGISLAVASGVFIGVSFVLKKVGLLRANVKYNEEAGEGYGYLKNLWWWSGMTLMIIGEICNFVAYAFVDAILVTPLGALSVVITTILSAIFLKERLSFVGKVGCFTCILGSVVIALNAPEQSSVADIQEMKQYVIAPGFLSYAGVIIVACAITAIWAGPRYGKRSMFVYISICSLIGGLSVVATQGLGAALLAQINGESQFKEWFMYVLLVFVVATLLTEIIYLNKALNIFNAALVTPTYYVFFTSSTIISSAVLFRGFKGSGMQIGTVILGFLQICAGVVLLQLSKSAKDVPDAAVFKGDLDQIREVATQEEPESEPKADAIRGTAAIIRRLSTPRRNFEAEEARRYYQERTEDSLSPPADNEVVEWDGLRRRKTVLSEKSSRSGLGPGLGSGSQRRTTPLPPLGMSRFPDDWEHDPSATPSVRSLMNELRSRTSSIMNSPWRPVADAPESTPVDHKAIDTNYTGAGSDPEAGTGAPPRTVSWADEEQNQQTHLAAPAPPPHRIFSFQKIFNRAKSPADRAAQHSPGRSRSPHRGILRRGHLRNMTSEEEHLGLVQGDTVAEYSNINKNDSDSDNENRNDNDNDHGNLKRTDTQYSYDGYNNYDGHYSNYDTYGYDEDQDHLPSGSEPNHRLPSHTSLYPQRLRVNPLPPLPDNESALDLGSQLSPIVSLPEPDELGRPEPQIRPSIQPHSESSRGSLSAIPRRQSGWRRRDSD